MGGRDIADLLAPRWPMPGFDPGHVDMIDDIVRMFRGMRNMRRFDPAG